MVYYFQNRFALDRLLPAAAATREAVRLRLPLAPNTTLLQQFHNGSLDTQSCPFLPGPLPHPSAHLQAVCAEVSAELKASVDAYTRDMDVGVLVYERLMAHPQASLLWGRAGMAAGVRLGVAAFQVGVLEGLFLLLRVKSLRIARIISTICPRRLN
jgi:hypothetical protein